MRGQCHRYAAYDTRPSRATGGSAPKRSNVEPRPDQITSSAPTTGSAAATPGNGVLASYRMQAAPMPATPSQVNVRCRCRLAPAKASNAPAANSQALVRVEKYATPGVVAVSQTE